jgi:hypothetical protein
MPLLVSAATSSHCSRRVGHAVAWRAVAFWRASRLVNTCCSVLPRAARCARLRRRHAACAAFLVCGSCGHAYRRLLAGRRRHRMAAVPSSTSPRLRVRRHRHAAARELAWSGGGRVRCVLNGDALLLRKLSARNISGARSAYRRALYRFAATSACMPLRAPSAMKDVASGRSSAPRAAFRAYDGFMVRMPPARVCLNCGQQRAVRNDVW